MTEFSVWAPRPGVVRLDVEDDARARGADALSRAARRVPEALDGLERAYTERNDYLAYLGVDPLADPLRSEPRFTQLLHRIGVQ